MVKAGAPSTKEAKQPKQAKASDEETKPQVCNVTIELLPTLVSLGPVCVPQAQLEPG